MSLQSAKAEAFLSMIKLKETRTVKSAARIDVQEKRAIAADRARVVNDALADRSDPEYVEIAAAEAWDAHQEHLRAKEEVGGLAHAARQRFDEHHAALDRLFVIQRQAPDYGDQ